MLLSVELPEATQSLELLGKDSSEIAFTVAGYTWHGSKGHAHVHSYERLLFFQTHMYPLFPKKFGNNVCIPICGCLGKGRKSDFPEKATSALANFQFSVQRGQKSTMAILVHSLRKTSAGI